ncbi:MAG: ABC transporter ATP-binding protein [Alphaproteobacteria bacterium]
MRAKSVTLRGLSKSFGDVQAVHPQDLEVRAGEFLTLLGPSGCGKTTVLRMIAGLEAATTGTIHVGEDDVTGQPPNRRDTSIMFQDYALFPHKSVRDNIAYGLKMRSQSAPDRAAAAEGWLARIGLAGYGDRLPAALSGGQRQRVALARALILEPGVLLLDEPLGALDAGLRRQLQIELRRLHRDVGLTFIAVTHDQEEAMTMSDRIAVMRDGRIEQLGTPQNIYDRPQTEFVARFLGRCSVIKGRAVAQEEGLVRVETEALGPVLATGTAVPGTTVRLALRPEALRLDDGAGVRALVTDAVFTGSAVRLGMTAADGTVLELDLPRGTPVPEAGGQVGLRLPPGAAILLAS